MSAAQDTGLNMRIVQHGMEEFIDEEDSLPTTSDIVEVVDLTKHHVEEALKYLERNGAIRRAYDKPKVATIWVPTHMWESLLHSKQRPGWMDEYGLSRRKEMEAAIREKEQERNRLRRIEELLYTSGRTLEEAIYTALSVLEVAQLSADFDDPNLWDFSFRLNSVFYIAEAKGKEGEATKRNVQQLESWLTKYVEEHPDVDPEQLCGLILINHYKDLPPSDRWPENESNHPLTNHAEKFLGLGRCRKFLTTIELFEIVAEVVNGESTPPQARERLEASMRRKVVADD